MNNSVDHYISIIKDLAPVVCTNKEFKMYFEEFPQEYLLHFNKLEWYDLIVGFVAEEDSVIQYFIKDEDGKHIFPEMKIKKGKFHLAWLGKEIIPRIRILYNSLGIEKYTGKVKMLVVGFESTHPFRRELCQRRVFELDEEWVVRWGKICRCNELGH